MLTLFGSCGASTGAKTADSTASNRTPPEMKATQCRRTDFHGNRNRSQRTVSRGSRKTGLEVEMLSIGLALSGHAETNARVKHDVAQIGEEIDEDKKDT